MTHAFFFKKKYIKALIYIQDETGSKQTRPISKTFETRISDPKRPQDGTGLAGRDMKYLHNPSRL